MAGEAYRACGFVVGVGEDADAALAKIGEAVRRMLASASSEVRVLVLADPPAGITLAHGEADVKFIEGGVVR